MRKSIVILGGKSDIGLSIAKKFHSKNFDIILACREIEDNLEFKNEIKNLFGNNCSIIEFNILDISSHTSFLEKVFLQVSKFKNTEYLENQISPDIVVNVIGKMTSTIKDKNDLKLYEEAMLSNYLCPVLLIESLVEKIRKTTTKCSIIGISSVAGERGRASNYIYGSAKSGFTEYLSGLRQRLHGTNISIQTIIPGFVRTKMLKDIKTPNFLTSTPDVVGKVVYNSYISGKEITYTKYWKLIMIIIKLIPETIFKRLKF